MWRTFPPSLATPGTFCQQEIQPYAPDWHFVMIAVFRHALLTLAPRLRGATRLGFRSSSALTVDFLWRFFEEFPFANHERSRKPKVESPLVAHLVTSCFWGGFNFQRVWIFQHQDHRLCLIPFENFLVCVFTSWVSLAKCGRGGGSAYLEVPNQRSLYKLIFYDDIVICSQYFWGNLQDESSSFWFFISMP